jgi:hypothetical protein
VEGNKRCVFGLVLGDYIVNSDDVQFGGSGESAWSKGHVPKPPTGNQIDGSRSSLYICNIDGVATIYLLAR